MRKYAKNYRRDRKDGYVELWSPGHPTAHKDSYALEHRLMAWDAGMLTNLADQVHHRNEVRNDNRLDNFEIKDAARHAREHAEERGYVTNQHGTFAVKPADDRASAKYPSAGYVRPERQCIGCGDPIPDAARADAEYCSANCRVKTWKRNRKRVA